MKEHIKIEFELIGWGRDYILDGYKRKVSSKLRIIKNYGGMDLIPPYLTRFIR